MKRVKNAKQAADSWTGQQIEPGEYYTIESFELGRWQNDAKVIVDIALGNLIMNDGTSDITDAAAALRFLKDEPPKTADGYIITSPTFENVGNLAPVWRGSLHQAPANTLSFFDESVNNQQKLREGWFKILSGGQIGDYIECSIIDKDDVLGLFAMFNLQVGQDVLELKKYIRTEYFSPEYRGRQEFKSDAVSELMAGLYVRVAYYNSGDNAATFTITRRYYET